MSEKAGERHGKLLSKCKAGDLMRQREFLSKADHGCRQNTKNWMIYALKNGFG
jgi:hypothetical protein